MTPADFLDLIVILGLAIMAVAGWRAGLVATTAAFLGFLGGAVVAGWLMAAALSGTELTPWLKAVLTAGAMSLLGVVGQTVLGRAAGKMRDSVTARPVRVLDSTTGVAVSLVAWLMAMWMLMSVLAYAPNSKASHLVLGSRTYGVLDGLLSEPGSQLLSDVRSLLTTLDVPTLAFNPATVPSVGDPSNDPIPQAAARVAADSVVAIDSTSTSCNSSVVGSGIVVAAQRVATNAHVVAGAERVSIRLSGSPTPLPATVVSFDPTEDLAVLHVPGLQASFPEWLVNAPNGLPAVVAGFPGGGPLRLEPARIRGSSEVPDAQGSGTRSVEVFRGVVRGGNSGGALLDADGRIIGVVFASLEDDETTGFALAPKDTLPAIRAALSLTGAVPTPGCPSSIG